MQACTIGLSINEDPKLEKGKEKKGSAARSFMRSSSHVSSRDFVYYNVYYNPPFSTSAVILPPPLKKPALRLYISVFYPLVKVLQGSKLIRVLVVELFKLLGASYKVLNGVLS